MCRLCVYGRLDFHVQRNIHPINVFMCVNATCACVFVEYAYTLYTMRAVCACLSREIAGYITNRVKVVWLNATTSNSIREIYLNGENYDGETEIFNSHKLRSIIS